MQLQNTPPLINLRLKTTTPFKLILNSFFIPKNNCNFDVVKWTDL